MSAQKKQEKNLPQIKTQQKCTNNYPWLDFPKKNAEEAGETYCRKVIFSTPQNSPIVNSSNKASVKEKESLHKLFEVAYLIPKKGRPFTDYHDLIQLEKLCGVKFDVTYDDKNACGDLIYQSKYFRHKC